MLRLSYIVEKQHSYCKPAYSTALFMVKNSNDSRLGNFPILNQEILTK